MTEIPIVLVTTHPTVRSLANALKELQKPHKHNPVIILQSHGSKTPLWLVHPGVGEVLVFLGFAKFMNDRPVHALRARGFEGEDSLSDITEAVGVYHKVIKVKQPTGPYAIAGYSYRSMLAFEIAKALKSKSNDEIKYLTSFNLPPHIKYRMRQLDWVKCLLNLSYFLKLVEPDYAMAMPPSPELHRPSHPRPSPQAHYPSRSSHSHVRTQFRRQEGRVVGGLGIKSTKYGLGIRPFGLNQQHQYVVIMPYL